MADILTVQCEGVSRMKGWIEGFQESIDFIEQNLTEELDITDIAGKAALSAYLWSSVRYDCR